MADGSVRMESWTLDRGFFRRRPGARLATLFAALLLLALFPSFAQAQRAEAEAYAGRPWGVARIVLPPGAVSPEIVDLNGCTLTQADGRALYPVFASGRLLKLIGGLLGAEADAPPALTVMFLFRGDSPFRVTVHAPQPIEFQVTPRTNPPRGHDRLLQRWWREYYAVSQQNESNGDVPPVVHAYLTSMLGRRLRLEPPPAAARAARRDAAGSLPQEVADALETLAGVERLRTETMRATMLRGDGLSDDASQMAPGGIPWGPNVEPAFDPDVRTEPLAARVPSDCLYIRFGKYSNYLWFNQLLKDYGGDISNMATQRALWNHKDERLQAQLAMPPVTPGGSALSDLLGEAAIADMALVGRDLYLDEGAAMGVLFQARTALLGVNFQKNRQTIAQREAAAGANLETVQIAGRDVSFLSTPDNRIRSFYAVSGDYHLMTTSRKIVEQFFAVADGTAPSLGSLAEFKHARTRLPLDRDDTVFVYLSSGFFRGLLEPQYQIETIRRLQSSTDLQLAQLARLAARHEGLDAVEFEELIAAGLLPPGFGRRPDGSGPLEVNGRWIDSLRGAPGTMLPVPDVELKGVTPGESRVCAARAAYHAANWKQMDPLVVAVKRTPLDMPGLERVEVDGQISPLDDSKYGRLLSVIGPPARERIASAEGDVISVQAHLRGGLLNPDIPPHWLFLGVQDMVPSADPRAPGLFETLRLLQTTPGYIGAWPKPGFLDLLPFNLGGGRNVDPLGYSRIPFGWRRQWDAFSAVAVDRRLLEFVTPQLKTEPAEDDAQIRVHVGNLARTQLAAWVDGLYYQRAREISRGNVELLHSLTQQFGVAPDAALPVAERLLNAEFYCPLGGDYELVAEPGGQPYWRSSKWPENGDARTPEAYVSPFLEWFRGLDSNFRKGDDQLLVHAHVVLQRRAAPKPPAVEGSLLDFFGGKKKAVREE